MGLSSENKIEDIAKKIAQSLQGLPIEISTKDEIITVNVKHENLVEVAKKLRGVGFDHVKSITATDFPEQKELEVIYHVSSFGDLDLAKVIVALKTRLSSDDPRISSLIEIWPSSKYSEREQHEMLGIVFEGHPELERLLLPEDYEGPPPLRKEFKVKTEGIQG